jgi:TonB family protein
MTLMLSDPPIKANMGSSMGVGFGANRSRFATDHEAWKRALGSKPVAARFELLPNGKSRLNRIGVSAIAQVILIGFVVLMPLLYPEKIKTVLHMDIITPLVPPIEIPVAPPPPRPKIKPEPTPPKQEVVEPVKLNPKQPHIFVTTKAVQPKIAKVEAKAPELTPVLEAAKIDTQNNQPKRPREEVKVNNLSSGSAAPATVVAPLNKVQTGGFGDPLGMPGEGDPKKSTNINRKGSPALPPGPGYGNGTGGDKGIRGTVASTGFGNGTANPPPGGSGKKGGTVQSGTFGDQSVVTEAPKKKAEAVANVTNGVTIIEKPRPEYTAEGRSLRLEGDVTLDLVFLANGTVHVNRVISGLGHGLDESAIRAAQQIKFKPAKQDNNPVDFPARVRIEFRMAY